MIVFVCFVSQSCFALAQTKGDCEKIDKNCDFANCIWNPTVPNSYGGACTERCNPSKQSVHTKPHKTIHSTTKIMKFVQLLVLFNCIFFKVF